MAFQPVIAGAGLAGWSFLQRTMEIQSTAFENSPSLLRDTDYFAEKIGEIDTAEELVADRRLLTVALGAFGLDDDINNSFFIKTMLDEGTLADDSLANRMADKRYVAFSKAFGFGDYSTPSTKISTFPDKIIDQYNTRQFEIAVGQQDDSIRLAMNAVRELETLSGDSSSDNAKWLSVLGSPPLRSVMEAAFGLPTSFGAIDLDKQIEVFREKMEKLTGDSEISQFTSEETRETMVERYLLMSQMNNTTVFSSSQIALQLLQY